MDISSLIHRFSNLINATMQHTFFAYVRQIGEPVDKARIKGEISYVKLNTNFKLDFIIINRSVPSPGALGFL